MCPGTILVYLSIWGKKTYTETTLRIHGTLSLSLGVPWIRKVVSVFTQLYLSRRYWAPLFDGRHRNLLIPEKKSINFILFSTMIEHECFFLFCFFTGNDITLPTKIEELTAGSDEKTQRRLFFVWSAIRLSVLLSLSELKEKIIKGELNPEMKLCELLVLGHCIHLPQILFACASSGQSYNVSSPAPPNFCDVIDTAMTGDPITFWGFLSFYRKVLFWSLQASSMFIFTLLRVSGKDLKS